MSGCRCRIDMDCWCAPDWKNSTAEEFANAISNLLHPTDICVERDGKCSRVPCCKNKPGEIAEPGW